MSSQSTTVKKVIDYCSQNTKLQTFLGVGGISNEPGLTFCNDTIQELLARPMAWKFNRNELSSTAGNFFVTQPFIQDYRFAGACAFVLGSGLPNGGVGIDLAASPINGGTAAISESGTTVTVQTLDPHPFTVGQTVFMSGNTVAAYNSTFTFNSTTQTSAWANGWVITSVADNLHFTFTHASSGLGTSGAPGITNWGWMESAWLTDINSGAFPQPVRQVDAVDRLAPKYGTGGGIDKVAMMVDYANGVLKFRVDPLPNVSSYQINIVYQARAGRLTSAVSTFQWPDNLSFVLNQCVLAKAMRMVDSARADMEDQRAQGYIAKALTAEDAEDNNAGMVPTMGIMR